MPRSDQLFLSHEGSVENSNPLTLLFGGFLWNRINGMIATTLTRTLIVPESFLIGMIFHLGKENHVKADSTFIHEVWRLPLSSSKCHCSAR